MNIYNSEMYPDPTAYHALSKIQKEEKAARYRPLVYICSPYSGDIAGNTEKAKRYCRFAIDTHSCSQRPIRTMSMNIARSRSVSSFINCRNRRCGAIGIAWLSIAKRQYLFAFSVFPAISPE